MAIKKNKNAIGLCAEDRIMYTVVNIVMVLLIIAIGYPLIYVVSSSFSSGAAVTAGRVVLWPVDFSTTGYKIVFSYKLIWTAYGNTIWITVVATVLNVILTTMAAYPLSRRNFQGRTIYTIFFMITMFFSGGMIPNYILMNQLHLNGTRWAIVLSGAISIYNMIVMRTFFVNSVPGELLEAAKIDGITDIGYLFRILIPLSKAVFAVVTLYYAVAHWNAYFNAMLYLRDRNLYPLQLVLRDILKANQNMDLADLDPEMLAQARDAANTIKYGLIVVATAPIMVAFPFIQRFFVKGVMIGSVKG